MLMLDATIINHAQSSVCVAGAPQAIVNLIAQICSSIAAVQHDRGACCDLAAFVCSAVGLLCKEKALRTGRVDLGMLSTELQAALDYVDGFSSGKWRQTLARVTHYSDPAKDMEGVRQRILNAVALSNLGVALTGLESHVMRRSICTVLREKGGFEAVAKNPIELQQVRHFAFCIACIQLAPFVGPSASC